MPYKTESMQSENIILSQINVRRKVLHVINLTHVCFDMLLLLLGTPKSRFSGRYFFLCEKEIVNTHNTLGYKISFHAGPRHSTFAILHKDLRTAILRISK